MSYCEPAENLRGGSIQRALEGIREFIRGYQAHPFDFLYEGDIQAILCSTLWSKFEGERVKLPGGRYKEYIDTIPVKVEYPSPGGDGPGTGKFDLAVIGTPKPYDPSTMTNDPFWNEPVCVAVEIKHLRIDSHLKKDFVGMGKDLERDVDKLSKYSRLADQAARPFVGVALLFAQTKELVTKLANYGYPLPPEANVNIQAQMGVYRCVVSPETVYWSPIDGSTS